MGLDDTRAVKNLIRSMEEVVERKGRVRLNGGVASERTVRMNMEVLRSFARTLHEAGFKVEVAENIGEKHIVAVFDNWVKVRCLSNKTLQNQKSRLKMFCGWLGKPGLGRVVSTIEGRYEETHPKGFTVVNVAVESKSWRRQGIDVEALIRAAMLQDKRHAGMLMLGRAFGLRKKEMLLVKLWKADKGTHLSLTGSVTKNGRPRDIEIESGEFGEMQRRVLDFAKAQCKRSEHLGWPELSLEQSERRYFHYNSMLGLTKAHLGMTGHGLRAGFAEDLMLLKGILPPTLGGTKEMSGEMDRVAAKYNASKALGHNRLEITHAYYGSDKRLAKAGTVLGFEVGTPMQMGKDTHALVWVSEKPKLIEGGDGRYEIAGEKAELAFVTIQIIRDGAEIDRMSVEQFIDRNPLGFDALNGRLSEIGFELKADS